MSISSIRTLSAGPENGFLPTPEENPDADLIYLCSPNNPTGAVYSREQLKKWVDWANSRGAVILFDAAYEAFIEDDSLPHSIFEIEGARTCAIEICSLSKTAGFTGTRLGYTVIPLDLERGGMSLNAMWVRNRTTKTNGVSYIIQKGGAAVFTPEGQEQIKKNIRYYKSQPWGVVDDILVGFYCDVDGDDAIKMDEGELKVAEWRAREEIELQPDDFSLTNEMMKMFKEGRA